MALGNICESIRTGQRPSCWPTLLVFGQCRTEFAGENCNTCALLLTANSFLFLWKKGVFLPWGLVVCCAGGAGLLLLVEQLKSQSDLEYSRHVCPVLEISHWTFLGFLWGKILMGSLHTALEFLPQVFCSICIVRVWHDRFPANRFHQFDWSQVGLQVLVNVRTCVTRWVQPTGIFAPDSWNWKATAEASERQREPAMADIEQVWSGFLQVRCLIFFSVNLQAILMSAMWSGM